MTPLYLLLTVAFVAAAGIWWRSRSEHDPASSVDHFNRALQAMQPVDAHAGSRTDARPTDATDAGTS